MRFYASTFLMLVALLGGGCVGIPIPQIKIAGNMPIHGTVVTVINNSDDWKVAAMSGGVAVVDDLGPGKHYSWRLPPNLSGAQALVDVVVIVKDEHNRRIGMGKKTVYHRGDEPQNVTLIIDQRWLRANVSDGY